MVLITCRSHLMPSASSTLWTPASISSQLAGWFVGDDTPSFTIDGNNRISQWNDKSGNNRHAENPNVDATRPNRSADLLNSRAGVRFVGESDQWLRWTYDNVFDIYVVAKANAITTGGFGYDAIVSAIATTTNDTTFIGGSFAVFLYWNGQEAVATNAAATDYVEYAEAVIPREVNTPIIIRFRRSSTQISVRVGEQTESGNINTIAPVRTHFIGADGYTASSATNSPVANFASADIYEIVYPNQNLSTENDDRMWGYLAHGWGLTDDLPTGHPYKTNPPTI